MLSLGAYMVISRGADALVALIPILAAHVLVFAVVFPLWRYFRRRQGAAAPTEGPRP
jgi:hypothetical protein